MLNSASFCINAIKPTKNVIAKNKIVLIIANTYLNTELELGTPVINDVNLITNKFFNHNYQILSLIDSNVETVINWLMFFSKQKFDDFILYYSGHGTLVENFTGKMKIGKHSFKLKEDEEITGKDSAYVFYNYQEKCVEFLVDDIFTELISKFKTDVFVISDCCHSGSVVDENFKLNNKNTMNLDFISACNDNQFALQNLNNGLFTNHIYNNFTKDVDEIIETFNNETKSQQARYKCTRKKLYK
jgi:hypothetical protein